MNKEEILSRVNEKEIDEMELAVLIKALGLSTIIIPIFSLLFILLRIISGNYIVSDLISITFAQVAVSEIFLYLKMKSKIKLVIAIISVVIALIFFFIYTGVELRL